jgi:hypothetical protein
MLVQDMFLHDLEFDLRITGTKLAGRKPQDLLILSKGLCNWLKKVFYLFKCLSKWLKGVVRDCCVRFRRDAVRHVSTFKKKSNIICLTDLFILRKNPAPKGGVSYNDENIAHW